MANFVQVFQFIKNEFKVVEIDIDNIVGAPNADETASLTVCNPKREIMETLMAENPGIYQFFIDRADLESNEVFDVNFRIAPEDEHVAEEIVE